MNTSASRAAFTSTYYYYCYLESNYCQTWKSKESPSNFVDRWRLTGSFPGSAIHSAVANGSGCSRCLTAEVSSPMPEMTKLFATHPALRYIYYVEDDCRLRPGKTFVDVHNAALAVGRRSVSRGVSPASGSSVRDASCQFQPSKVTMEEVPEIKPPVGATWAINTPLNRRAGMCSESVL